MSITRSWTRRMFLHATAAAPAAWLAARAALAQTPPSTDIELEIPAIGEAPSLRLLGKRIFNCYKYLSSISLPQREGMSADEKAFADAAKQLDRSLDPFGLGVLSYFEFGMIEAGSETGLLTGLERQGRLFSTGVAAAVAQALDVYEREVWPRHRALIQEALPPLEKHFGSESERLLATQAARLGYQKFPPQFTVSLVVPPVPRLSYSHPTVISLTEVEGNDLIERLLRELTRVVAFENADAPGTARLLLDSALARKGLPPQARLQIWQLLESWTTGELVRERVDTSYVPSSVRQRLFDHVSQAFKVKVSEALLRTLWEKYEQGKLDLAAAMQQLADAVV